MKRQNTPAYWNDISVTIDGHEIAGSYSVDKTDWMTVRMNGGGSKSTRGGPAAASQTNDEIGSQCRLMRRCCDVRGKTL